MQYYQCKCGDKQMWNSGTTVHDCQGCIVCQTTYAQHKDYHKELIPHDFNKILYNQKTGKPYKMCVRCSELDIDSYRESRKQNENIT